MMTRVKELFCEMRLVGQTKLTQLKPELDQFVKGETSRNVQSLKKRTCDTQVKPKSSTAHLPNCIQPIELAPIVDSSKINSTVLTQTAI